MNLILSPNPSPSQNQHLNLNLHPSQRQRQRQSQHPHLNQNQHLRQSLLYFTSKASSKGKKSAVASKMPLPPV